MYQAALATGSQGLSTVQVVPASQVVLPEKPMPCFVVRLLIRVPRDDQMLTPHWPQTATPRAGALSASVAATDSTKDFILDLGSLRAAHPCEGGFMYSATE